MNSVEMRLFLQPTRHVYIKLLVMDKSFNIIDDITGLCVGGNYTIDEDSAIRRTCNLEFVYDPKFVKEKNDLYWINKRFQVLLGIKDLQYDNIVWFNNGIYCVRDPSASITLDGSKISVQGLDLMALLNGDVAGFLPSPIKILPNTNVSTAIRETLVELGYESRFIIEQTDKVIPMLIEKDAGDTVWDALEEIRDLYMRWELYYDEDGYVVFAKKRVLTSDPIIWDFSMTPKLILDIKTTLNTSNIKNHVAVWGKVQDDNSQASYEIYVRDSNYPNSPFTIEKLDEGIYSPELGYVERPRSLSIWDKTYITDAQCKSRCEYEVFKHTNMAQTIDITCVPIYGLTVGALIYVDRPQDKIEGVYAIKKITCDLKFDGQMTIEAYKVYDDYTGEN